MSVDEWIDKGKLSVCVYTQWNIVIFADENIAMQHGDIV